MYWIYRTRSYVCTGEFVQAKLVSPPAHSLVEEYAQLGFRSPLQDEPYNVELDLIYRVNPKHPFPDNYMDSFGFKLFSERLVDLMDAFGVRFEVFPVKLVSKHGTIEPAPRYFAFHSLEGVRNAMDESRSEWTGDWHNGIPRLVLDYSKFEHRPIFKCNHIYVPLMREDLKQEILRQGISGFEFLDPEQYRSGKYGFSPDFDD